MRPAARTETGWRSARVQDFVGRMEERPQPLLLRCASAQSSTGAADARTRSAATSSEPRQALRPLDPDRGPTRPRRCRCRWSNRSPHGSAGRPRRWPRSGDCLAQRRAIEAQPRQAAATAVGLPSRRRSGKPGARSRAAAPPRSALHGRVAVEGGGPLAASSSSPATARRLASMKRAPPPTAPFRWASLPIGIYEVEGSNDGYSIQMQHGNRAAGRRGRQST